MTRERDDTGQYVETVGLEDVIDVFEAVDGPAVTSSDVAQALNCTTEAARQKLTRLYDRGVLDKRKSGRTVIYWRTGGAVARDVTPSEPRHGTRHVDPNDAFWEAETYAGEESGDDVSPSEPPAPVDALETTLEMTIDDVANDVLPGSGEKLEARREALHAVVEYLRENGEAEPKDFKRDVYPDHPAEYTNGATPANSWWKNAMYKGLRELAENDDRLQKADQSGRWTWNA